MLALRTIRDHPELVTQGAANKGEKVDIDAILALDGDVRRIIKDVEKLRAQKNRARAAET
ncbi:MAG: seryl-tRNA synthetase, partial [Candidatus Scalindua rubra]